MVVEIARFRRVASQPRVTAVGKEPDVGIARELVHRAFASLGAHSDGCSDFGRRMRPAPVSTPPRKMSDSRLRPLDSVLKLRAAVVTLPRNFGAVRESYIRLNRELV